MSGEGRRGAGVEAGISVEYWGSGVVVGLEVESGGNGARGGGEGEGDAEAEGEDVMRSVMVAELDGTATMDGSMALTMATTTIHPRR